MSDRFYGQRDGKNGYKKAGASHIPRRLKQDIINDICKVMDAELPSLKNVTVADLNTLLDYVNDLRT